jgi:hypothetical protein
VFGSFVLKGGVVETRGEGEAVVADSLRLVVQEQKSVRIDNSATVV